MKYRFEYNGIAYEIKHDKRHFINQQTGEQPRYPMSQKEQLYYILKKMV